MSMRVRHFAVMLLVLVLPWQALTVVAMPTGLHYHDATAVNAEPLHHAHAHHAGYQHREHDGSTSPHNQEPGSTDTSQGTCTEDCCSEVLVADGPVSLGIADHQGLIIPFATHRLPSRTPDSLERPPRNSLV
jgi:hypothetical protein